MLSRYLNLRIHLLIMTGLLLPVVSVAVFWVMGLFHTYGMETSGVVQVIMIVLVVLVGVILWVLAGIMARWPQVRPTYEQLKAFGRPRELIAAIDRELDDTSGILCIGKPPRSLSSPSHLAGRLLVLRSWVVQFLPELEVRAVPLEEIIWVRRTMAPRGSPHEYVIEVRTRRGLAEVFGLKKPEADQLLIELIGRLPWVMTGYNEPWERDWLGDRAPLLARVEAQRQQIQALPEEKRRAMIDDKVTQARDQIGPARS